MHAHDPIRTPLRRLDSALTPASSLHRCQQREKTGVADIAHLLCVSDMVLEGGGDENQGIAALLHDAAETMEACMCWRPSSLVGRDVAELVEQCSEPLDRSLPSTDRSAACLEHVTEIAGE